MARASAVNNVPKQNGFNRAHERQAAILAALPSFGDLRPLPDGELVQETITTGEVIDRLGLPRTRGNYASVSRSLDRLARRGLVDVYVAGVRLQGRSYRYARARHG